MKDDIKSHLLPELQHIMTDMEAEYRAGQIFKWLHGGVNPDEMTDIEGAAQQAGRGFPQYRKQSASWYRKTAR